MQIAQAWKDQWHELLGGCNHGDDADPAAKSAGAQPPHALRSKNRGLYRGSTAGVAALRSVSGVSSHPQVGPATPLGQRETAPALGSSGIARLRG